MASKIEELGLGDEVEKMRALGLKPANIAHGLMNNGANAHLIGDGKVTESDVDAYLHERTDAVLTVLAKDLSTDRAAMLARGLLTQSIVENVALLNRGNEIAEELADLAVEAIRTYREQAEAARMEGLDPPPPSYLATAEQTRKWVETTMKKIQLIMGNDTITTIIHSGESPMDKASGHAGAIQFAKAVAKEMQLECSCGRQVSPSVTDVAFAMTRVGDPGDVIDV